MGTIEEMEAFLNNNRDRILLVHSIGEDLVKKIEDAGGTYKVNKDRSVDFNNCSDSLLDEIKAARRD